MLRNSESESFQLQDTEQILGIDFFQGTLEEACCQARAGGLTVAPSGPGMACDLTKCDEYCLSLNKADLRLLDSGFISFWSRLFFMKKLRRISGLTFLKEYLSKTNWKSESSIWIMPNQEQSHANIEWVKKEFNFQVPSGCVYVAPLYSKKGKIVDKKLLKLVERKKPENIFIQLGGGVQERLGYFLCKSCPPSVSIICTGAALSFLSGQQAKIPAWADRFFCGWLLRCLDKPKIFIPRYIKAFRLVYLLLRFGKKLPAG